MVGPWFFVALFFLCSAVFALAFGGSLAVALLFGSQYATFGALLGFAAISLAKPLGHWAAVRDWSRK